MLTTAAAAAPSSPNPKSNPNHPSKTGRRPLQPTNHLHHHVPKPQRTRWIEISPSTAGHDESNKENPGHHHPPTTKKSQIEETKTTTTLDASLAEELSAIREKLERMRLDKDETEKMLRARDLVLDMQMNRLLERGQIQRMLEIEVDRLYRLNQLRSSCLVSPIRSLRHKEQEKKIKEDNMVKSVKTEVDRADELKSGSTSPNHHALITRRVPCSVGHIGEAKFPFGNLERLLLQVALFRYVEYLLGRALPPFHQCIWDGQNTVSS